MGGNAALVACVDAIYTAASEPDSWPDALDSMAACYSAVGAVLMLRRSSGFYVTIASPALVAAAADYEAGGWRQDFMAARAIEAVHLNSNTVYTDRHLATRQEIAQHPFYVDFRARHGLGPFLGAVVSPDPEVQVIISMQGALHRRPFSEAEVESFGRLVRHVERALVLSIRLIDAEAGKSALADSLARLSCGAFFIGEDGRVTFANETARALIDGPLRITDGKLGTRHRDGGRLTETIADVLSRASNGDASPMLLYSGQGFDQPTHVLYVLPTRGRSSQADMLSANVRAIVLALPWAVGGPVDPAVLRDLLGLTLGEARVASLVGAGRTPREASQALGITEGSARTILKRVFAKVGVSRQAELATKLTRSMLRDS